MRRGFPQLAWMWMALLLPMVLRNLLAITLNGMHRGFPQLAWMWLAPLLPRVLRNLLAIALQSLKDERHSRHSLEKAFFLNHFGHLFWEPYRASFSKAFAKFLLSAHSATFVGRAFFLGSFPFFLMSRHHLTKRVCSPAVFVCGTTMIEFARGEL